VSTTDQSALRRYEADGWGLIESTPDRPRRRVLLLPGLFCTAEFYVDVLADEALAAGGVAALAADPPGFAGRPAPDGFDFSIESYAALVEGFAARESIDLVVGHSYTANVGIEMAARGRFAGKLLLLSPSLSREDEEDDLRSLDGASRTPVLGTLVWLGINLTLKRGMRDRLPSARFEELLGEMKRNPRSVNRRLVTGFFDHLAKHGGLAERLAAARSTVWLGRGDRDEVGMTDEERAILEAGPNVTLKTIPGAAHFSITDTPDAVARLVLDLLADDAS
jgi:pimeloyl-ACP methyl ester carboxylesterase